MIRALGLLAALALAARAQAEVPEPPALWGDAGCRELAGWRLERVAERIEERLAAASRDASLADPGQRRYLEEVAAATVEDLILVLSELGALRDLPGEPEPSPADLHGLLGDLFLVAGRPRQAVQAYRRAFAAEPDKPARCAAVDDGKLYTFESGPYPTPYVLSRDPETGQVLERFLLPSAPTAFSIGRSGLHVLYPTPYSHNDLRSIRLAEARLDYPIWVPHYLLSRLALRGAGLRLAGNFARRVDDKPNPDFALRRRVDEDLPADLESLEAALRQAVRRDPTQPWHLLVLGQCLWAQGRRSEAAAVWQGLFAAEFQETPYYDYARMAWYFELYRQPAWADAAFRQALERRRGMPLPVTRSTLIERMVNVPTRRLLAAEEWPELDVERAYMWWLRLREISGVGEGDGFRAVLWANYFESIGDGERAAAERAYADRARQAWPRPVVAYVDYATWLLLASGGLLSLYVALALRGSWRLLRGFCRKNVLRFVMFSIASQVTGAFFYLRPSPLLALSLMTLILLTFLSFLPLFLSALRYWRRSLGAAGRRRRLGACVYRCGVDLVPLLAFGLSLAALSFATFYAVQVASSLDLTDVQEQQPSATEEATPEQRLGAALASHGIGDFERARRLYASLPQTPAVRSNLRALARGLPPLVEDLVPYEPPADLPALAREWLRNESRQPWRQPWRLSYEIFGAWVGPIAADLVAGFAAPVQYFLATDPYARKALLASPLALLALFLRPVRRWTGRALTVLVPGAGFLRRGQPLRACLVFWLFLFAAGPICWLLLAAASPPDFVDAFGPHAGPGMISSLTFMSTIPEDDFALPPPAYARLLAENRWSLLWVYPHAGLFYSLVALSLLAALFVHGRQIPEILGFARAGRPAGARLPVKVGRRILPYERRILPYERWRPSYERWILASERRRLPCVRRRLRRPEPIGKILAAAMADVRRVLTTPIGRRATQPPLPPPQGGAVARRRRGWSESAAATAPSIEWELVEVEDE